MQRRKEEKVKKEKRRVEKGEREGQVEKDSNGGKKEIQH